MSDKKLKISLDLDDKAFTSAIKRMQDQLNQIQSGPAMMAQQRKISQYMQSQGMGGLTGVGGAREQEQAQRKANQESDRIFQKSVTQLNIIKRLQNDINKELISGLATEQRKADLKERLSTLGRKEKEYTGYSTAGMAAGAGGGAGLLTNRGGQGGFAGDPIKALASISGAIGTAFAAVGLAQQVENIRRSFAEAGYRAIEINSKAISQSGAPGAQFSALYGGKSMEEYMFRGERGQAHETASAEMQGRLRNPLSAILRPRQTLMSALGNEGQKEQIKQELRDEFYKEQASQYEALKSSPEGLKKMAALQQFQGKSADYLSTQRMLGLDYSGFHGPGGFRSTAIGAGFTDEMASQMSGQIIGAGGSTRMARGSTLGLQAQRGFDTTNAGGVLGTLSQTLGGAEQSKSAFIKMLAEGSRLGLDSSEYREENRKFLDVTAQVVSRSETGRQQDIDSIIKRFGGFMAEPTTRGVQAAQGAFQAYNQITSSNTGPQGVMRAAGFLKDEVIGKMSPMDRASLSTIPADQLSADHPVIQSLARKYNTTGDDLVGRVRASGAGAVHRLPQGDALTKSLMSKRAAMQGPWSPAKLGQMGGEIAGQEQDLAGIVSLEYPELAKNRKQLEAFIKGNYAA